MNGKLLVKLARDTISGHFSGEQPDTTKARKQFDKRQGVFVTLSRNGRLRGCIGFPVPLYPLWQGVMKAALSAAFQDPRFEALKEEELPEIEIEVSVLTPPELIGASSPAEYPEKIEIGRDGLIIELGYHSGLLLPQVATEYKWDARTFLEHLCLKAGLSPQAWKSRDAKLYKFQARIFKEA